MSVEIRVDEWLAELEKLANIKKSDGGAKTTLELSQASGMTQAGIRKRLKEAIDKGLWEHVVITRKGINGVLYQAHGYRPKPKVGLRKAGK